MQFISNTLRSVNHLDEKKGSCQLYLKCFVNVSVLWLFLTKSLISMRYMTVHARIKRGIVGPDPPPLKKHQLSTFL